MARAQKEAEKEANAIVNSLSHASEAAISTTLTQIQEKLRNNVPLMYHMWALLHNEDWTAVLVASIDGRKPDPLAATGQAPVRKLRSGMKKLFSTSAGHRVDKQIQRASCRFMPFVSREACFTFYALC